MIKLKVSYEHPDELKKLLCVLGPTVDRWKVAKRQEGQFIKAYIYLKLI